ncbi:Pol I core factor CF [Mortierella claussenii]|nr:Pol I core factor CF [Mortierella claussenii]
MSTRIKAKKPPCRICRSRKWRKNSLGFYVCEFGHQMEGFQEEEGEFDANMGATFLRKQKTQKRKRKTKEARVFEGINADYLLLQAIQLVFRRQIHSLIHELGFPPELEQVAHEYWTLYISGLASYQDKWESAAATYSQSAMERQDVQSDEGDQNSEGSRRGQNSEFGSLHNQGPNRFKDKAVMPVSKPDQLDTMNEYQGDESDTSSEESDSAEEESPDAETDGPGEGSGSHNESADEDHVGYSTQQKKKQPLRRNPRERGDRTRFFSMPHLIAMCYLAAQHLDVPVVFEDFYRWTMQRKIIYYNAFDTLPSDMKFRLAPSRQSLLLPRHRRRGVFESATALLAKQFKKKFGLEAVWPHMPPLIFRFTQDLMLPDGKSRMNCKWMKSEMSGSLIYIFPICDVISEFEELIQVNPDLYADFAKFELRPAPNPDIPKLMAVFEDTALPTLSAEHSSSKQKSPGIEAFIRKLHRDVPLPEHINQDDPYQPPPLKPGEGFVHYKHDTVNIYLGQYGRLLSYASSVLGLGPDQLQEEVQFVERVLVAEPHTTIEVLER